MTFSKSKKNVKPNIEKKGTFGLKMENNKKKLKSARKDDGKKY